MRKPQVSVRSEVYDRLAKFASDENMSVPEALEFMLHLVLNDRNVATDLLSRTRNDGNLTNMCNTAVGGRICTKRLGHQGQHEDNTGVRFGRFARY